MSIENNPAPKTKRGFTPKVLLWAIPLLTVCLLIPGVLTVALFDGGGVRGLDLLNHDPLNLLPQMLLAGTYVGLLVLLGLALAIGVLVMASRGLRKLSLKGAK